jgi:hypothetical protein
MSETPEHSTEPIAPVATSTATVPPPYVPADPVVVENKPNRLYQIAAWVAIVAGSLFIVAVIFFSGFALGRHAGGAGHFGGGHHRHHFGMSEQAGPPMMNGPMMRGPGMWGPGGGPGMWRPGPDQSGPGQIPGQQPPQGPGPSPTAPARP